MGRPSPLSAGVFTALLMLLAASTTRVNAAPVQETAMSRYTNQKGCYYLNELYPSGEKIRTNEPCLNCTCVDSTLMCYLRVCPFVKPVGQNCMSEMHVGDCCPKYWCPEVYPRVTTEKPDSEPRGCFLDGRYYDEGARIPMDPFKPCEVCYCIRNTSVCTMQECELKVDGCFPQYKAGCCCPARYNCTDEAATTIPPGVMEPEDYEGCRVGDKLYRDGDPVPSENKCETCFCMKHAVACAVQKCTAPADSCVPGEVEPGQCCPTKYECALTTEVPEWHSTLAPFGEDSTSNFSLTTGIEHESSATETSTFDVSIQARTQSTEQDSETTSVSTSTLQPFEASTNDSVSKEAILGKVTDAPGVVETSSFAEASEVTDAPEATKTSGASEVTETAGAAVTFEVTDESEISGVSGTTRSITIEPTTLSEVTEAPSTQNVTVTTSDLVSRSREPKITEVPDDLFKTSTIRPVFFPSRPIPGEGTCRHENRTFKPKEKVASLDPCRKNCMCVNSVWQCEIFVECVVATRKNCKRIPPAEGECCPTYACEEESTSAPTTTMKEDLKTFAAEVKPTTTEIERVTDTRATTTGMQEEVSFDAEDFSESPTKHSQEPFSTEGTTLGGKIQETPVTDTSEKISIVVTQSSATQTPSTEGPEKLDEKTASSEFQRTSETSRVTTTSTSTEVKVSDDEAGETPTTKSSMVFATEKLPSTPSVLTIETKEPFETEVPSKLTEEVKETQFSTTPAMTSTPSVPEVKLTTETSFTPDSSATIETISELVSTKDGESTLLQESEFVETKPTVKTTIQEDEHERITSGFETSTPEAAFTHSTKDDSMETTTVGPMSTHKTSAESTLVTEIVSETTVFDSVEGKPVEKTTEETEIKSAEITVPSTDETETTDTYDFSKSTQIEFKATTRKPSISTDSSTLEDEEADKTTISTIHDKTDVVTTEDVKTSTHEYSTTVAPEIPHSVKTTYSQDTEGTSFTQTVKTSTESNATEEDVEEKTFTSVSEEVPESTSAELKLVVTEAADTTTKSKPTKTISIKDEDSSTLQEKSLDVTEFKHAVTDSVTSSVPTTLKESETETSSTTLKPTTETSKIQFAETTLASHTETVTTQKEEESKATVATEKEITIFGITESDFETSPPSIDVGTSKTTTLETESPVSTMKTSSPEELKVTPSPIVEDKTDESTFIPKTIVSETVTQETKLSTPSQVSDTESSSETSVLDKLTETSTHYISTQSTRIPETVSTTLKPETTHILDISVTTETSGEKVETEETDAHLPAITTTGISFEEKLNETSDLTTKLVATATSISETFTATTKSSIVEGSPAALETTEQESEGLSSSPTMDSETTTDLSTLHTFLSSKETTTATSVPEEPTTPHTIHLTAETMISKETTIQVTEKTTPPAIQLTTLPTTSETSEIKVTEKEDELTTKSKTVSDAKTDSQVSTTTVSLDEKTTDTVKTVTPEIKVTTLEEEFTVVTVTDASPKREFEVASLNRTEVGETDSTLGPKFTEATQPSDVEISSTVSVQTEKSTASPVTSITAATDRLVENVTDEVLKDVSTTVDDTVSIHTDFSIILKDAEEIDVTTKSSITASELSEAPVSEEHVTYSTVLSTDTTEKLVTEMESTSTLKTEKDHVDEKTTDLSSTQETTSMEIKTSTDSITTLPDESVKSTLHLAEKTTTISETESTTFKLKGATDMISTGTDIPYTSEAVISTEAGITTPSELFVTSEKETASTHLEKTTPSSLEDTEQTEEDKEVSRIDSILPRIPFSTFGPEIEKDIETTQATVTEIMESEISKTPESITDKSTAEWSTSAKTTVTELVTATPSTASFSTAISDKETEEISTIYEQFSTQTEGVPTSTLPEELFDTELNETKVEFTPSEESKIPETLRTQTTPLAESHEVITESVTVTLQDLNRTELSTQDVSTTPSSILETSETIEEFKSSIYATDFTTKKVTTLGETFPTLEDDIPKSITETTQEKTTTTHKISSEATTSVTGHAVEKAHTPTFESTEVDEKTVVTGFTTENITDEIKTSLETSSVIPTTEGGAEILSTTERTPITITEIKAESHPPLSTTSDEVTDYPEKLSTHILESDATTLIYEITSTEKISSVVSTHVSESSEKLETDEMITDVTSLPQATTLKTNVTDVLELEAESTTAQVTTIAEETVPLEKKTTLAEVITETAKITVTESTEPPLIQSTVKTTHLGFEATTLPVELDEKYSTTTTASTEIAETVTPKETITPDIATKMDALETEITSEHSTFGVTQESKTSTEVGSTLEDGTLTPGEIKIKEIAHDQETTISPITVSPQESLTTKSSDDIDATIFEYSEKTIETIEPEKITVTSLSDASKLNQTDITTPVVKIMDSTISSTKTESPLIDKTSPEATSIFSTFEAETTTFAVTSTLVDIEKSSIVPELISTVTSTASTTKLFEPKRELTTLKDEETSEDEKISFIHTTEASLSSSETLITSTESSTEITSFHSESSTAFTPIETTSAKLTEIPTTRPNETISSKTIETTSTKPSEITYIKPIETTSIQPIETTSIQPIETTSIQPIETTSIQPIETTSTRTIETTTALQDISSDFTKTPFELTTESSLSSITDFKKDHEETSEDLSTEIFEGDEKLTTLMFTSHETKSPFDIETISHETESTELTTAQSIFTGKVTLPDKEPGVTEQPKTTEIGIQTTESQTVESTESFSSSSELIVTKDTLSTTTKFAAPLTTDSSKDTQTEITKEIVTPETLTVVEAKTTEAEELPLSISMDTTKEDVEVKLLISTTVTPEIPDSTTTISKKITSESKEISSPTVLDAEVSTLTSEIETEYTKHAPTVATTGLKLETTTPAAAITDDIVKHTTIDETTDFPTTKSITEASVVSEEIIISNVTFGIDSMVISHSTTVVPITSSQMEEEVITDRGTTIVSTTSEISSTSQPDKIDIDRKGLKEESTTAEKVTTEEILKTTTDTTPLPLKDITQPKPSTTIGIIESEEAHDGTEVTMASTKVSEKATPEIITQAQTTESTATKSSSILLTTKETFLTTEETHDAERIDITEEKVDELSTNAETVSTGLPETTKGDFSSITTLKEIEITLKETTESITESEKISTHKTEITTNEISAYDLSTTGTPTSIKLEEITTPKVTTATKTTEVPFRISAYDLSTTGTPTSIKLEEITTPKETTATKTTEVPFRTVTTSAADEVPISPIILTSDISTEEPKPSITPAAETTEEPRLSTIIETETEEPKQSTTTAAEVEKPAHKSTVQAAQTEESEQFSTQESDTEEPKQSPTTEATEVKEPTPQSTTQAAQTEESKQSTAQETETEDSRLSTTQESETEEPKQSTTAAVKESTLQLTTQEAETEDSRLSTTQESETKESKQSTTTAATFEVKEPTPQSTTQAPQTEESKQSTTQESETEEPKQSTTAAVKESTLQSTTQVAQTEESKQSTTQEAETEDSRLSTTQESETEEPKQSITTAAAEVKESTPQSTTQAAQTEESKQSTTQEAEAEDSRTSITQESEAEELKQSTTTEAEVEKTTPQSTTQAAQTEEPKSTDIEGATEAVLLSKEKDEILGKEITLQDIPSTSAVSHETSTASEVTEFIATTEKALFTDIPSILGKKLTEATQSPEIPSTTASIAEEKDQSTMKAETSTYTAKPSTMPQISEISTVTVHEGSADTKSPAEFTPTTEAPIDTPVTSELIKKTEPTESPEEDESLSTTEIEGVKETTDASIEKHEETTESLEVKASVTTTTKAAITEEPVSAVTESTSSTATTTTESVTGASSEILEAELTTQQESEVKTTTQEVEEMTTIEAAAVKKDECFVNGTLYGSGQPIKTVEPCEKCHCASGEIVCFKIFCKLPMRGCVAEKFFADECCPSTYRCPADDGSLSTITLAHAQSTTEKDFTTPIPISFMFSTTPTAIQSTKLVTKSDDKTLMTTVTQDLISEFTKQSLSPSEKTEDSTKTPESTKIAETSGTLSDDTVTTIEAKPEITTVVSETRPTSTESHTETESKFTTTFELTSKTDLVDESSIDAKESSATETYLTTASAETTTVKDEHITEKPITTSETAEVSTPSIILVTDKVATTISTDAKETTATPSEDITDVTSESFEAKTEVHLTTSLAEKTTVKDEHITEKPKLTSGSTEISTPSITLSADKVTTTIASTEVVVTTDLTTDNISSTSIPEATKEASQTVDISTSTLESKGTTTILPPITASEDLKTTFKATPSTKEQSVMTSGYGDINTSTVTTRSAETTVSEKVIDEVTDEDTSKSAETTAETYTPAKQPKLEDTITSTIKPTTEEWTTKKQEPIFTTTKLSEVTTEKEIKQSTVEDSTTSTFVEKETEASVTFSETGFDETVVTSIHPETTKHDLVSQTTIVFDTISTSVEPSSESSILSETFTTGMKTQVSDEVSSFSSSVSTLETVIEDFKTTNAPLESTTFKIVTYSGIKEVHTTESKTEESSERVTETPSKPTTLEILSSVRPEESQETITETGKTIPTISSLETSTLPKDLEVETDYLPKTTISEYKPKEVDLLTSAETEQSSSPSTISEVTTQIQEIDKTEKSSVATEGTKTEFSDVPSTSTTMTFISPEEDVRISTQDAESTESFEFVTETIESKGTISSLSKEGTTPSEKELKPETTETDISAITVKYEDRLTSTTEEPQSIQPKTTVALDEAKSTDTVFRFVSTRFTDKAKETTFSEDFRKTTVSIPAQVSTLITKEIMTTKGPSIKSLDTEAPFMKESTITQESTTREVPVSQPATTPESSDTTEKPHTTEVIARVQNETEVTQFDRSEGVTQEDSSEVFSTQSPTEIVKADKEYTVSTIPPTITQHTTFIKSTTESELFTTPEVKITTKTDEEPITAERITSITTQKPTTESETTDTDKLPVTADTELPSTSSPTSLPSDTTTQSQETTTKGKTTLPTDRSTEKEMLPKSISVTDDLLAQSIETTSKAFDAETKTLTYKEISSTTLEEKLDEEGASQSESTSSVVADTTKPSTESVSSSESTPVITATAVISESLPPIDLSTTVESSESPVPTMAPTTLTELSTEERQTSESTISRDETSKSSQTTTIEVKIATDKFTASSMVEEIISTTPSVQVTAEEEAETTSSSIIPVDKDSRIALGPSKLEFTTEDIVSNVTESATATEPSTVRITELPTEKDMKTSTEQTPAASTEKYTTAERTTVAPTKILSEVSTESATEAVTEKSTTTERVTVVTTGISSEVSTGKTTEMFTAKFTEAASTERVTEAPTERVTEAPTERVTEAQTERVTEAPTERTTKAPTEGTPEASTLNATEVITEKVTTPSTSVSSIITDASSEKTTEAVTEKTVNQSTIESSTKRDTEIPTKAYKAIETTPTPLTTESSVTENATAEDDFLLDEGVCVFEGQIYHSAEQILRSDPCEFCFCFRGDIICLQQSCPPPAPNCKSTMIPGYCCPRYDCPVLVTSLNMTNLTRRKGVQPIIIQKRIEKRAVRAAVEVKGCQIDKKFYPVGSTVAKASGPCLHCECEEGGNMRCDPLKCKPEAPLMLKMNNHFFRNR